MEIVELAISVLGQLLKRQIVEQLQFPNKRGAFMLLSAICQKMCANLLDLKKHWKPIEGLLYTKDLKTNNLASEHYFSETLFRRLGSFAIILLMI